MSFLFALITVCSTLALARESSCRGYCVIVDSAAQRVTFLGKVLPSEELVSTTGRYAANVVSCIDFAEAHGYESRQAQVVRSLWFSPWFYNFSAYTRKHHIAPPQLDENGNIASGDYYYRADGRLDNPADSESHFYFQRGTEANITVSPTYLTTTDCS